MRHSLNGVTRGRGPGSNATVRQDGPVHIAGACGATGFDAMGKLLGARGSLEFDSENLSKRSMYQIF